MGVLEFIFVIVAFGFLFLLLLAIGIAVVIYLVTRQRKDETALQRPLVSQPTPAPDVNQPLEEVMPETRVQEPPETFGERGESTHTCGHCGRELKEEWTHCPYCGAPVQFTI